MKFMRLGGVLAGAMLLAPLATSTAQAAEITPASVAPSAYVQSDDCHYTHWYYGRWHRHVRLVCDDNDDYYGGGNWNRGGHFNRGGGEHRNFGGGNRGNFGGNRGNGGNRGTGGGNFRGGNSGGGHGGHR